MLRRRALLGKSLPYDAEVTYIESDGTQWIDLLYHVNPNTEFYWNMKFTPFDVTPSSYRNFFIGLHDGPDSNNNVFRFNIGSGGSDTSLKTIYYWPYKTSAGGAQTISYNYGNNMYNRSTMHYVNGKVTFQGINTTLQSCTTTYTGTNTLCLYYTNSNGDRIFSGHKLRTYSFRVVENGVTLMYLIPVRKGSVGYLYDLLSGQMFGNSGTGNFNLGEDINTLSVDLGLSSGTIWARSNVGTNKETDYGNFYQPGKGARTFQETWGEPVYSGQENPLSLNVDTARQVMGEPWKMPTSTQWDELIANTTCLWIDDFRNSGHNGLLFISKINENRLFVPAAGYRSADYDGEHRLEGSNAYLWSSTPSSGGTILAYRFRVVNGSVTLSQIGATRNHGMSVRGVYAP